MESRNVPNRKNSSVTRSITYHLLECKIFYIKSWKRRSRNVCRLPDWFEIFAFWNTLEKFYVIISKSVTVVIEGPSSEYSGSRQCSPPHANLRKSSGFLRKTEATDCPVISIYLLQTEFRATKICLFMWRLWQAFGLSEVKFTVSRFKKTRGQNWVENSLVLQDISFVDQKLLFSPYPLIHHT